MTLLSPWYVDACSPRCSASSVESRADSETVSRCENESRKGYLREAWLVVGALRRADGVCVKMLHCDGHLCQQYPTRSYLLFGRVQAGALGARSSIAILASETQSSPAGASGVASLLSDQPLQTRR